MLKHILKNPELVLEEPRVLQGAEGGGCGHPRAGDPALGSHSMKLALHGIESGLSPRRPDQRESRIGVGALPRSSASRAGPDLRPLQPQEAPSWGQGRGAPRSPGRGPTCPTSGSNSRLSKFPNDLDGASSCPPRTHLMGR